MDERGQYIDRRIDELYDKCVSIIKQYEYEQYKDLLSEAKEICEEIENSVWTDCTQELCIARSEAYYYLGKACFKKSFFNHAVEYFSKAKKAVESCCVQDINPKLYVLICICLAKCYTEKRSKDKNIRKAIDDAERVFCFAMWKNKSIIKLAEISNISDIILGIKQYPENYREDECEQKIEEEEEEYKEKCLRKIKKETYLSVGFELCLHRVYAELEISDKEKDEKNFDEVLKYFEIAEGLWLSSDSDSEKLKENMESLLATKGRWYKKAYFKEDKEEREKLEKIKEEAENKYLARKAQLLRNAIEQFYYGLEGYKVTGGKAQEQCGVCKDRLYEGNKKDTICLGNMAALLYNASLLLLHRKFCSPKNAELWKKEVAEQYQKIYEALKGEEKNISLCSREEVYNFCRCLAREITEKILGIDRVNMYALSLAAILCDTEAENSQEEKQETVSVSQEKKNRTVKDIRERFSVSEKSNHYPMLRRSAIKKRFQMMNDDWNSCLGHKENFSTEAPLSRIQIYLIIMHNIIIDFMDSAVINYEDSEWKNLVVGHYTRLPVLQKLINKEGNSKLRIQNVHHLNDPTEGVVLINSLKNKYRKSTANKKAGEPIGQPENENKIGLYEQVIDNFSVEKNGKFRSSVYMGSFSARVDKLNMWTQYGDHCRGCCIQIDAAKTFDKVPNIILGENSNNDETNMFTYDDYNYPLYAVIYLPFNREADLDKLAEYALKRSEAEILIDDEGYSEKAWWEKQAELIKGYKKLIEDLDIILSEIDGAFSKIEYEFSENQKNLREEVENEKRKKSFRKLKDEIVNTIMILLDMARFLVKSDWYREEREFRVIQYSSKPMYDENPQGVPLLYVNIEKQIAYKRVCFGPLVQNYDSEAAYVLNIKRNWPDSYRKKTWELEAYKSEIAYR